MLGIKAFLVCCSFDFIRIETSLRNPIIVHHLAHVVPGGVSKQHSHSLVFPDVVLLDETVGTGHCGSATASNQQTLVPDDRAHCGKSLVVISLNPIIGDLSVKHCGNEVVADTFYLVGCQSFLSCAGRSIIHGVRLCENTAVRIDCHYLDTWNLFFQLLRSARNGSTSSRRHDHVVQLSSCLLHDLLSGTIVVCKWVSWMLVLVQHMPVEILCEARRQEDV
mmetsp:Transcript_43744/g.69219  ORF Transcript_43744/g.69219 Transcript_43744/m.69219 type:complete len:221 (+) Transcript_43744:395-1057(+)